MLTVEQTDEILTACGWMDSRFHDALRKDQIRRSFSRTLNMTLQIGASEQAEKIQSTDVLSAARAVVAMTFAEARAADDAGRPLLYCEVDVLNPCWSGAWSKEHGKGKHWGGGDACPSCRLRAAIAATD